MYGTIISSCLHEMIAGGKYCIWHATHVFTFTSTSTTTSTAAVLITNTLTAIIVVLCCVCSEKVSFTLWDHWDVRGGKNFKLSDFLKAVEVSLLQYSYM